MRHPCCASAAGLLAWLGWSAGLSAADVRIGPGSWNFSFTEGGLILAVPYLNNEEGAFSGPIRIRLIGTLVDDGSGETGEFLLAEINGESLAPLEERIGVYDGPFIEEPPGDSVLVVAVNLHEETENGFQLRSESESPTPIIVPDIPTEAEIRRRVAGAVPCGSLFVQFTSVTFAGLMMMRFIRPRRGDQPLSDAAGGANRACLTFR